MKIRKILCPVDFSETSSRAADYAVELASDVGGSVSFVHAWMLPIAAMPDGTVLYGPDVAQSIADGLGKSLDQLVSRYRDRGVKLESRLVEGPPYLEIVRLARELGVDVIVMGTHGRTGLPHLLLGSVAGRVVRTSPVPVLTVPPARQSSQP